MGWPIFVAARLGSLTELIESIRQYRAAWKEAGHPGEGEVALRLPVFVANTLDDALSIPRDSTMGFYRFLSERLLESASRAGTRAIEARAERGAPGLPRSRTRKPSATSSRTERRRS